MNYNFLLFFLFATSFANCQQSGQSADTENWFATIDSILTVHHKSNHFDGTIVIGTKNKILYENAFGTANRGWDIAISDDTRFDIASINKSFLAALILKAIEENRLFIVVAFLI